MLRLRLLYESIDGAIDGGLVGWAVQLTVADGGRAVGDQRRSS
jgi:hypothetical protein